jgi:hypothetical protein
VDDGPRPRRATHPAGTYDDIAPLIAHPELPTDRPFTHSHAAGVGISREVLRRMVREGLLRRVLKGVYVDAAAEDDLRMRARAVALAVPDSAVVTDRTAAWLHGVDVLRPGDHLVPPQQALTHHSAEHLTADPDLRRVAVGERPVGRQLRVRGQRCDVVVHPRRMRRAARPWTVVHRSRCADPSDLRRHAAEWAG